MYLEYRKFSISKIQKPTVKQPPRFFTVGFTENNPITNPDSTSIGALDIELGIGLFQKMYRNSENPIVN